MFLLLKINTISLLMTEAYFYHWDYDLIILNLLPRPTYVTLCKISCLQWGVRKMGWEQDFFWTLHKTVSWGWWKRAGWMTQVETIMGFLLCELSKLYQQFKCRSHWRYRLCIFMYELTSIFLYGFYLLPVTCGLKAYNSPFVLGDSFLYKIWAASSCSSQGRQEWM